MPRYILNKTKAWLYGGLAFVLLILELLGWHEFLILINE